MSSGLVALQVFLQLSLSSALTERCELPYSREEDRGTSGLLQQTLPLVCQAHCDGYITSQVWADGSKTRGRSSVTSWQTCPDDPKIKPRRDYLHYKFKK